MVRCSRCDSELPENARFCLSCGAAQSSASQMPTVSSPRPPTRVHVPGEPIGRLDPAAGSSAIFEPGRLLAGRYRIVGLLGRGGMGDVYRADDLKLAQPVSLKFLPPSLAERAGFLERFHSEVRNARHVSHPNVCRVYDIGEVDGHHFISMEYVDGEDLATLLRRIGRLPKGKADEVARQLCAGLAAAHDKGVLHRDLKPSNVMLDGSGRIRITDFGLAVSPGEASSGEMAGTPAYMAPEQFEGKPVTVQSDLYSLGLILFEIYVGRRAFEASGFAEWKSRHSTTLPPSPGQVQPDVGDAAERVILRCLEKDPSRRPGSALQVAAALPGGDPLAAALAAGETPSPEMVAAAGGEGALSPRKAWGLLAAAVTLVGVVLAVAPYSTDLGLAPMTKSREVLQERAREVVKLLGYDAEPLDSDAWFARDYDPMKYLANRMPSPEWRREVRRWGPPVLLVYRQSPRYLVPRRPASGAGPVQVRRVGVDDPPLDISGMVLVTIDAYERLRLFQAVPPQVDSTPGVASTDWGPLFAAAHLDSAHFARVAPQWVPPVPFDACAEWVGPAPWASEVPLRLSAAAWRGRPVYFEVHGPWSRPSRMELNPLPRPRRIAGAVLAVMILTLIGAGVYLALRNIRLGRGDRRGAVRLAVFGWAGTMILWAFGAHHVPDLVTGMGDFLGAVGFSMTTAAFFGFVYLALEPYVRRNIPELLIGWARILEGRFNDPRVGRDVLIGAGMGTLTAVVVHVSNGLPTWFPLGGQTTMPPDADALSGGRLLMMYLLAVPFRSLAPSILGFGVFFLLLVLLRKRLVAAVILTVFVTLTGLGGENVALETTAALVIGLMIVTVTVRYGILASTAGAFFHILLVTAPLPLDLRAPYATQSVIVVLVLLALVLYAFRISLGPRPVFNLALDE